MSEILAPRESARRPVADTGVALANVLGVAGRFIALLCALALTWVALSNGLTLLGSVQPLAIAGVLVVAASARRGASLVALGYVFMFLSFVYLRTLADETVVPVHFGYPVFLEQIMFLGVIPTVWLQDLLYVPGRVGPLDVVLAVTYVSYFVAPHLATIIVWKTRPDLFPRVVLAVSLTFIVGLGFYFLIPTAPPWLASDAGDIDGVRRVMPELSALVAGDVYDETSRAIGENDVAAMPSLHTALTVTVALIMSRYGPVWRRAGIAYAGLMGVALVYLGEHYVIDELAGVALALGIWKLVFGRAWSSRLATRPNEAEREGFGSGYSRAA